MATKKVYVFPGQGSQVKGMGKDLFDQYLQQVELASQVLGYSLRTLCLDDPEGKLGLTQYTQPALFSVCALTYQRKMQETGQSPDFVAGHSLGEYAALFAAGAFDFETGLRLVQKRGELMGQVSGGGMAAVIGVTAEKIREALAASSLKGIDVANFNAYEQTVVAGPKEEITEAAKVFASAGARLTVPLNVSAPFHSRYMRDVANTFADFLKPFTFAPLKIAVIANCSAQPYRDAEVHGNLARQIDSSVRWVESVEHLLRQGEVEFEEIGPGVVLTKLVQQIRKKFSPAT